MNIGGSSLPSMLNYFHVYYSDVVLWQSWVPTTQGQYVGTIFAILAFGVVSTGLKTLSACLVSLSETNSRGYVKLGIMGAGDPLSVEDELNISQDIEASIHDIGSKLGLEETMQSF